MQGIQASNKLKRIEKCLEGKITLEKHQMKRIFIPIFIILALCTQQINAFAKSQYPVDTNAELIQQVATPTPSLAEQTPGRPPLSLTLALLGMCCIFGLVIGVFILGFVVRSGNKKEWEAKKKSETSDDSH